MWTVEELNAATLCALNGQEPAARGLPDTPEVRALIADVKADIASVPDTSVVDMVSEWPEHDDGELDGLYGETAAEQAARLGL